MTSAPVADQELERRHKTMWASGNYPAMVETFLLPLGPRLVQACGIGAGMRVLDVAAGTGNAALPAAEAGADVVASDLTVGLLAVGRQQAEQWGLTGDYGEHVKACYGPTIAVRANADRDGRAQEFDAALDAFCDRWNRGGDGSARFEKEYLLSVGVRR